MNSTLTTGFPIDLSAFQPLTLDPAEASLNEQQLSALQANVNLARDAIICFTAVAAARGLGGHTGGPYDIVPEVLIADGFIRHGQKVAPGYYDEAGHRVAIQYLMSVLNGHLSADRLMYYRASDSKLPGHPERDFTPGVTFSSGRLGHMWPYVNGIAMAEPDRSVFMFGSDGSQQEGNDAEAARLAVARQLNVKLLIDDNDVTIAGFPSQYMPGFDVARTLEGHGLQVDIGDGEDLPTLYERMAKSLRTDGPVALINRRKMAPGIPGLEGSNHAHDVIKPDVAIEYLSARGHDAAVEAIKAVEKPSRKVVHLGSSAPEGANRDLFGVVVSDLIDTMEAGERAKRVCVIDSDLEGSCGLHHIRKRHPEVYVSSGVMERGNFSAAAGFGAGKDRQGIFGTFSAFLEMCISEITMARLNEANVLCHFSHAGCDDMADNTCHFGVNNLFADGGLGADDTTRLYCAADVNQMRAMIERIFLDPGLRFVFTTRSKVPQILDTEGRPYFDEGYRFEPGKDDIIRQGTDGWVVSYGEMLYRSLDAVERLRAEGLDVGLINKPTLNVADPDTLDRIGSSKFVLVVESQNVRTGLGSRFGSWLLQRGHGPKFDHLGTNRIGNGGLWEHMYHQGLDPDSIKAKVESLAG